ncbi:MAG TPA: hypothetical protein DCQ31_01105 [Bacteroidales bacterium]|nr:hypothetical protein [Bacteroidales bacterium]
MKTTKLHIVTQCISSEELIAYAQGKLSPREKHAIEMHAHNCPMCSDALEGAVLLKNPHRFEHHISAINKKIFEKTNRKIWYFSRPVLMAAASVALLVFLSAYMVFYIQTIANLKQAAAYEALVIADSLDLLAMNESSEIIEIIAPETEYKQTSNGASAKQLYTAVNADSIAKATIASAELEEIISKELPVNLEKIETVTVEKEKVLADIGTISDSNKIAITENSKESARNMGAKSSKKLSDSVKKDAAEFSYSEALTLYRAKKYAKSLECISAMEAEAKLPLHSLLLRAKCYIALEKYAEAEQILTAMLNAGNSYADSAKFYLKTIPQNRGIKN